MYFSNSLAVACLADIFGGTKIAIEEFVESPMLIASIIAVATIIELYVW